MGLPRRLAVLVFTLSAAALAAEPAKQTPNPALVEAFKDMSGTWTCTGNMDNPQSQGSAVKTRSEMKIASQLGGFAYSGTYTMEKNAAMPGGMKAQLHWAWDAAKNKLVEFGIDNVGSTWSGTSDGQKGDTLVWTEEGAMMGQAAKTRTTVTRKGSNQITVVSELDNKGAWQKMGEDHCKKK